MFARERVKCLLGQSVCRWSTGKTAQTRPVFCYRQVCGQCVMDPLKEKGVWRGEEIKGSSTVVLYRRTALCLAIAHTHKKGAGSLFAVFVSIL